MHRSAAVVSMATAWSSSQSSDCKRGATPESSPKLMRIYGPDPPLTHTHTLSSLAKQKAATTSLSHMPPLPCFSAFLPATLLTAAVTDTVSRYTLLTFSPERSRSRAWAQGQTSNSGMETRCRTDRQTDRQDFLGHNHMGPLPMPLKHQPPTPTLASKVQHTRSGL